jgi:hypothetical protein
MIERVNTALAREGLVRSLAVDVMARGRIETREPHGFRVAVSLAAASGGFVGTRIIDSDATDCRALDAAIVAVMTVMLNMRREDILPPPAVVAPPPPPVEPVSTTHAHVSGGVGALWGLLPALAFETSASAGVRFVDTTIAVGAAYVVTTPVNQAEGAIDVKGGLLHARLEHAVLDVLSLRAQFEGGLLWAKGSGF